MSNVTSNAEYTTLIVESNTAKSVHKLWQVKLPNTISYLALTSGTTNVITTQLTTTYFELYYLRLLLLLQLWLQFVDNVIP